MNTTLRIPKAQLTAGLESVLVAVSDDPSRPQLHQVQIWQDGDKLNLAGTDSHWLAIWQYVVDTTHDIPRFAITKSDAEFLAGVLKLDSKSVGKLTEDGLEPGDDSDPEIELELSPALEIIGDRWSIRLPHITEGPDLDALLKSTERGSIPCITVDPELLAATRKAFRIAGGLKKGEEVIELGFGPTVLSPVLVTSPAVLDLACVIVPKKPDSVEMREQKNEVLFVSKSTGEVVHTEPKDRQVCIAGTEPDYVAKAAGKMQELADKTDAPISVSVNGGEAATFKPKKRGRKSTPKATEVDE